MTRRHVTALVVFFLTPIASTWADAPPPPESPPAGAPAHAALPLPEEPAPDFAKTPTLYTVGYAHLDTEWRWAYPQTIREFIANTLHNNFPLFEKYPHYIFNFSGSRRYQMMQEYYPDEYCTLKQLVTDGRWFPCGSSVDENDANVPSAESLIRHVLYGNRFFRREFGVASEEYMLPDCFGFPAALPSVLAHCGIKGFSTQKLTWGSAAGIPFKVGVWEGPDGRSVIAALDPGSYTGEVRDNLATSEAWKTRIDNNGAKSGVFVDYHYYGTGDQGGAPAEDSVRMVEESVNTSGPVHVISSHADSMFKAITPEMRGRLPRYKGELLLTEHSAGSISSQAYMKRWNRKNELLADAAERASVLAWQLGGTPYPAQALETAWTLVLGSQMHDILPGTSLPKAYEYAWNDEVIALNEFASVTQDAVGSIARGMDTRAEGFPIIVFNPLSIEREDVVEATIPFAGAAPQGVRVIGPDGKETPAQIVSAEHGALKIAFLARLAPVGFGVFDIRPVAAAPTGESEFKTGPDFVENARYRVRLDSNGDVASIFDNLAKREMLSAPARLAFHFEMPRQWPAWNMDWADRQKPARGYVEGPAAIRVLESGPARAVIEISRASEGSRFSQRISLGAGGAGDRVDFDTTIDWMTRERCLKATFPLGVANPKATYDIQVGAIERDNNNPKRYECPSHKWFDLTDVKGDYGVSVLSDSKYASDKPNDNTLRLTLLYTPGVRGSYQDQGTQDIGRHHMLYALAGHPGDWRATTPWQAARVNQPLMAFSAPKHEGSLGRTVSLAKCGNEQVAICAIKKAEESDEIIIRLRELRGADAKGVRISLRAPVLGAREVDGQERPIGTANISEGELITDVPAFGLRAFALKTDLGAGSAAESTPITLPFDADVISTNQNRSDGAIDGQGHSLPAEQFPDELTVGGVRFRLGSTADGKKNALLCRGQKIPLQKEGFDRIYVLAASTGADTAATFRAGTASTDLAIQRWEGYIGQWDNRLWKGDVPEQAFVWSNEWAGLEPGYIKRAPIAWTCSHHHTPTGDAYYQRCYIFKHALDVAPDADSITLPDNPKVCIFAITAVRNAHDQAAPAAPLYDAFDDRSQDAPSISPHSGSFADSTPVTITPGLYWREGSIHYTTDGSDPTAQSAVYAAPFFLASPQKVRARVFDGAGKPGPVVDVSLEIRDTTPPSISKAQSLALVPRLDVVFSEPVDRAAASDSSRYTLDPAIRVEAAALSDDSTRVMLRLASPLADDARYTLQVRGIPDVSPARNLMAPANISVSAHGPLFHLAEVTPDQRTTEIQLDTLPSRSANQWTLNMFVRVNKQPENRTVIAGFGRCTDARDGFGRYICKFANGIHFWSRNADVEGNTPLDLDRWQMISATYDGATLRLYKDGVLLGSRAAVLANDDAVINLMPPDPWEQKRVFDGDIRELTIWDEALAPESLDALRKSVSIH